jgi:hypothetical protein
MIAVRLSASVRMACEVVRLNGSHGGSQHWPLFRCFRPLHRPAKITAETELRCLLFVSWVFRPFAMQHPETAWALLEMMVQRVRDAENR